MSKVFCSQSIVAGTLASLREAGRDGRERVVLWLSPRGETAEYTIAEFFVPRQETAEDYFRIPPDSMRELMAHLRDRRLSLRAQVHSHPKDAFHSRADDKWAIVRHEGALSIVVPRFAADTTPENFLARIAAFQLSSDDRWLGVATEHIDALFGMI